MAITAITIENFKGIKSPVRVEFKPITLLFGPNSAGKSTIVQALHYSLEIFERQNVNPDRTILGGNSIDLGGFESLVYQKDKSLPIKIRFDLDLTEESLPRYLEGYEDFGIMRWEESNLWDIPEQVRDAWVEVTIRWSHILEKPLLSSYCVGINGEILATIETTDDGRQVNLTKLAPFNPVFLGELSVEASQKSAVKLMQGENLNGEEIEDLGEIFLRLFDLLNTEGGVPGITKSIALVAKDTAIPRWGSPLRLHRSLWAKDVPFEEEGAFVQLLSSLIIGPGELVRDGLRKFCYVGPLREVPQRNHKPLTSPDESRWANGLAAYDQLYFAEDSLIEKINEWIYKKDRLNTGYTVEVKKYYELEASSNLAKTILSGEPLCNELECRKTLLDLPIKRRLLIRDEARGIELDPQDIGVGISQILPVVVAALKHKSGFIAIEQPELHIHPAFQVALGDLFIAQIAENPDVIFLLETHSEHLLLRLLRRIRETNEEDLPFGYLELKPEKLSINYIEPIDTMEGEFKETRIRRLMVSDDGDSLGQWPKGFFEERAEELL